MEETRESLQETTAQELRIPVHRLLDDSTHALDKLTFVLIALAELDTCNSDDATAGLCEIIGESIDTLRAAVGEMGRQLRAQH